MISKATLNLSQLLSHCERSPGVEVQLVAVTSGPPRAPPPRQCQTHRWDRLSACRFRGRSGLIAWSDPFWWSLRRMHRLTLFSCLLSCSGIQSSHWCVRRNRVLSEWGEWEIERGKLKITPKLKPLLPNPRVGCCLNEIWISFVALQKL